MKKKLKRWKVFYQIAPWPSRCRSITVEASESCGARGLAGDRLSKRYGKKNVRMNLKTKLLAQ